MTHDHERPVRGIIVELRELLAKATPGTWYADKGRIVGGPDEMPTQAIIIATTYGLASNRNNNADLIVAMRNSLEQLLEAAQSGEEVGDSWVAARLDADTAKEERDQLREQLGELRHELTSAIERAQSERHTAEVVEAKLAEAEKERDELKRQVAMDSECIRRMQDAGFKAEAKLATLEKALKSIRGYLESDLNSPLCLRDRIMLDDKKEAHEDIDEMLDIIDSALATPPQQDSEKRVTQAEIDALVKGQRMP